MGGSGGGGYFSGRTSPEELLGKIREAEAKSTDASFEGTVNDLLAAKLGEINDRDTEAFREILSRAKDGIEKDFEDSVELRFGGSVAKHTYVDGLSDVDALVVLKDLAKDETPSELRNRFAEVLKTRFGSDKVSIGNLAVTLQIGDKTVQFLPALRTGDRFRISDDTGRKWSTINPETFARKLTSTNAKLAGKLVPTIKLAKSIIAGFPEQRRIAGYHVESLAIAIFQDYTSPKTPRAMLKHFFDAGAERVKQPIVDSTGQSVHVDDDLGPANSVSRRIIADAFSRTAR